MPRFAPLCALALDLLLLLMGGLCVAPAARAEQMPPAVYAAPEQASADVTGAGPAEATQAVVVPGAEGAAVITEAVPPTPSQARRRQLLRNGSSYLGPVGGIRVIDAGSGAPGTFRLQVSTDFFIKHDYLFNEDKTRYVGGALALSVTPIEHLELSAAATTRNVWSKRPRSSALPNGVDESSQTFGDPSFDVKGYGEVADGVTLGGDLAVDILTKDVEDDVDYAGTSFGVRANVAFDLRRMKPKLPLQLRANVGYYYDESHKIVESLERDRLGLLRSQGVALAEPDEYRHLARRNERLAYAINRVDHASIALGLEAPLALGKRASIHPIAEWELWIPIDRQDFDCPHVLVSGGGKLPGDDSCLADEGVDTWPQRLLAGARIYPGWAGLSLLAALEVGVSGTTNFVRELAPTMPYRVLFAASYVVDPFPEPTVVIKRVEVPVAATEGRVRGSLIDQDASVPIANARVTFPGRAVSPLLTDDQGSFVSYEFPPGAVIMEIEAEGYHPGRCDAEIPATGGEVAVRCTLVALPRVGTVRGRVLDAFGAPVRAAVVAIAGQVPRSATSDAEGQFVEQDLPPGEYRARIDQAGYLFASVPFQVEARRENALELRLLARPKTPLVKVVNNKLLLKGAIDFLPDSAELAPQSALVLAEVADLLEHDPTLLQIEVQSHSADAEGEARNLELSQSRAEAVRDWLMRTGIAFDRLVARGYGSGKKLAPGSSVADRARNRRVELVILQRAGVPVKPPTPFAPKAPTPRVAPAKPTAP